MWICIFQHKRCIRGIAGWCDDLTESYIQSSLGSHRQYPPSEYCITKKFLSTSLGDLSRSAFSWLGPSGLSDRLCVCVLVWSYNLHFLKREDVLIRTHAFCFSYHSYASWRHLCIYFHICCLSCCFHVGIEHPCVQTNSRVSLFHWGILRLL